MSDRFAALRALPRLHPAAHALSASNIKAAEDKQVKKSIPKPTKCKPNDLCHCNSHKKYKKCCMSSDMQERVSSSPFAQIQEIMRKDKKLAANVRELAKSMAPAGTIVK